MGEAVLATLMPFVQRKDAFTRADCNGSLKFHHDIVHQVLSREPRISVHLFDNLMQQARETEPAVRELALQFGTSRVQVKTATQMPFLVEQYDYVFISNAPGFLPLARSRMALGEASYSICSFFHSTMFNDPFSFYANVISSLQPWDALVVSSDAALRSVREGFAQVNRFFSTTTGKFADHSEWAPIITKIPLCIDEDAFVMMDQAVCRHALSVTHASSVILYLGRLAEDYKADLEPLLLSYRELLREDSGLILILAGQDLGEDYARHLHAFGSELGISKNVRILSNFSPALKSILLGAADIFVSPVDNVQESFGLSLLEAMAAGLPIVASDWSGYRDIIVDQETGFLVPTFWSEPAAEVLSWLAPIASTPTAEAYASRRTIVDTRKLHEYLKTLMCNKDLRRRMGMAGQARARMHFSWSVVLNRFQALWNALIEKRKCFCGNERPLAGPDFNTMYRHFARYVLEMDCVVRCSDLGMAVTSGENGYASLSGKLNGDFGIAVAEILETCAIPHDIQSLVNKGGPFAYEAILWLLKKGFCELVY